jgi:hypothetical protein
MGFLDWLYLGILLMRIAGVIDWDWRIVLSPIFIIVGAGFLYALWPYKGGRNHE